MLYSKPALSFEDQADLLLMRGLTADRSELISRLKAVSYYRLSGYLYPFRKRDATGKVLNDFEPGTNLALIWRRYNFDRKLRIILLDAIERIEVSVRTQFVFYFARDHGAFGHLNTQNLPRFKTQNLLRRIWKSCCKRKWQKTDHENWLGKLSNEYKRASETFAIHFRANYGDKHNQLPLWMACELMTCETTLQFANGVERSLPKKVGVHFGIPDEQLLSWMKAIFSLRNACAHHARIWNRVFGVKPAVPGKNKNPNWHITPGFDNERVGFMLTICYQWLGKISSTSNWRQRVFDLFDAFPEVPLDQMGIPPSWRTHPLWL